MPSQPPFAPHGSLQDFEDTLFLENMPVEFSSLKQVRVYFDILNRRVLNWYADCNYQRPGEPDHPTEVDLHEHQTTALCPVLLVAGVVGKATTKELQAYW
ncbi:hypothetical protein BGAL_0271g00070 [Botrytis galanthina]|uniref:Uncharacterized protein n=1 Tax=Botrytis galanthina TaxID=278940 RepID=A0A4S8QUI1_9HELO|nr:hypothetical protein BGAL_0271g00070 [Botrytis galanthina]